MKKFLISLLVILFGPSVFSQTQILDVYPPNQYFYEGGEANFLKNLQQTTINNGDQPCANSEEHYLVKFIVFPDRTIKFVKDENLTNIQKNKCAFDFTKNVFKYLNGWTPVIVNGVGYPALAQYDINPSDILKYKINGDEAQNYTSAEYRGGNTAFSIGIQKLLGPIFESNFSSLNDQRIMLRFKISKFGVIEDVEIPHSMPFRLKDEILEAAQGLQKWKPATKYGIPVSQIISVSLRFGN